MSRRMHVANGWQWTQEREDAALLLADDRLSDEAIAAQVGVSLITLRRWRQQPAFGARVSEHVEAHRARILKRGIADRVKRVDALDRRWQKMQTVIEERAVSEEYQNVPGGATGLLVRQLKQIGAGRDAQVVEEYAVDTGLLRELRAHEQQAAQELGQWVEKRAETDGEGVSLLDRLRQMAVSVQEVPAHLLASPASESAVEAEARVVE